MGKLLACNFSSKILLADGIVLAKTAAKCTAGEKDGTAPPGAADAWLLPVVESGTCGFYSMAASTIPGVCIAVDPAVSGTETAGFIDMGKIHMINS